MTRPAYLVRNTRAILAVGAHMGREANPTGWEVAVDLIAGLHRAGGPWVRVFVLGWGYDDAVPLRPWPTPWGWRTRHVTPRGNVTCGVAWCGFFFTIGDTP